MAEAIVSAAARSGLAHQGERWQRAPPTPAPIAPLIRSGRLP